MLNCKSIARRLWVLGPSWTILEVSRKPLCFVESTKQKYGRYLLRQFDCIHKGNKNVIRFDTETLLLEEIAVHFFVLDQLFDLW